MIIFCQNFEDGLGNR